MCLIRYLMSVFSVVRSLLNPHYSRLCNSATKIHSKTSALLSFTGFNISNTYICIYQTHHRPQAEIKRTQKIKGYLRGGLHDLHLTVACSNPKISCRGWSFPENEGFFKSVPPKKGPFQKDVLILRKYVSFRGAINITVSPIKTPPCTTSG